jgi:NNP family nitrate/nitrite transporter-like MFS transporter
MNLRDFRRAGHGPTLLCAFLYFDVSFMVWVLIGALANSIAPALGLDDFQRGLLLAVPLLSGALLRLPLGALADRYGARRTALLGMTLTLVPLLLGWLWADRYPAMMVVGVLLGVAGASFAAALPLASRWYPPEYQGLAMGIAGAGNSGTVLATLFCPLLVRSLGDWHLVFALALIPILLVLVVFAVLAKDSPSQPPPQRLTDYVAVLRERDAWWFCLFYSVTFGGFVGFSMFLNTFFSKQFFQAEPEYGKVYAGYFATLCVISGSFLRPVGGYLSDRFGGIRILTFLFAGVGATMLALATLPPLAATAALLFLGMALLGLGNGSVFQLVPQRFAREIGVITGIVGAAGGVGGFFLNMLMGSLKQSTGSYAGGFLIFGLVGLGCAVALVRVSRSWEATFVGRGGRAATVAEPAEDVAAAEMGAEPVSS